MSWAAHDLEPYVIQKHLGRRIAFVPLLIGSYAPDMFSKWFVYGVNVFEIGLLKADDPAQFHRSWPGVGFTHSLPFGVLVGLLIYAVGRNRLWAFSFVIGHWAHSITDIGDTLGTMLFFPFTTELFSVGAWAYAGQTGRLTDAGAYFSGFGFVWDGIWILWGILSWRVLTRAYFRNTVMQADGFWRWGSKHFSETALITLYRGAFFYGTTRWIAWLAWAHLVRSFAFDFRWGGPSWVPAVRADDLESKSASCGCPSCRANNPRFVMYGAMFAIARLRHGPRATQELRAEVPLRFGSGRLRRTWQRRRRARDRGG